MDGYLHTVYPHEYDPTRGANPRPQPRAATDRPRSTALDRRRFQNHRSHRSREQTIDRSIDSIDRHPLPVDGASALERARMPTTTRRVRVGGRGKTPRTRTIADAFRHAKSGIGVARDKKRGACARARASFSCEFSSFPTRARGVDRWTDERWMCARAHIHRSSVHRSTPRARVGNDENSHENDARARAHAPRFLSRATPIPDFACLNASAIVRVRGVFPRPPTRTLRVVVGILARSSADAPSTGRGCRSIESIDRSMVCSRDRCDRWF